MIVGIIVLLVACYVVYFIASAKTRRERTIEGLIRVMLARGRRDATFTDVYFDAARRYAIEKGSQYPDPDAASADVLIDGRRWFVTFSRNPVGRGTLVSLLDGDKMTRDVEEFARAPSKKDPPRSRGAADVFVEAWVGDFDASEGEARRAMLKRPSWIIDNEIITGVHEHVIKQCAQAGTPHGCVMALFFEADVQRLVFGCMATAENVGHELQFQQAVAAALLIHIWNQLSDETKARAREVSLDDLEPVELYRLMNSQEDADA